MEVEHLELISLITCKDVRTNQNGSFDLIECGWVGTKVKSFPVNIPQLMFLSFWMKDPGDSEKEEFEIRVINSQGSDVYPRCIDSVSFKKSIGIGMATFALQNIAIHSPGEHRIDLRFGDKHKEGWIFFILQE